MATKSFLWQDNQNNDIASFQFSELHLKNYITKHRPSLQCEKSYSALKYDWIPENHTSQKKVIKALFRSKIYPEITATSEVDLEKYFEENPFTHEAITHENVQKRMQDWLASSGHSALQKKELIYKAALVKQDLKKTKKQRLEDNNVIIKDISVDSLRWESYVYYVTLYNAISDTSAKEHWRTPEEALEKSFIEMQNRHQSYKNRIEKLKKEQPEFMYMRSEFEDTINWLWYYVRSREKLDDTYIVDLSEKWFFDKKIIATWTSRQAAFEKAVEKAEKIGSKKNDEKKWWLDVTHLSTNTVFDILDGNPDSIHEVHKTAIYNEIGNQIESWSEVTFTKNELEEFKKYCIETEQYEMALKVKEYLEFWH